MDRQPVLTGERLALRPMEAGDWPALFAVASDPQIWAVHPAHDRWQEPVFRAYFEEGLASGGALAVTLDKVAADCANAERAASANIASRDVKCA